MNKDGHMLKGQNSIIGPAIRLGLLGGAIGLFLCMVGMVEIFGKRFLIEGIVTLGHSLLLMTALGLGFLASRQTSERAQRNKALASLLAGSISGLTVGAVLAALVAIGSAVDLRVVFLTASPALYSMLTFGGGVARAWILILVGALAGLTGAGFYLLPARLRHPILRGLLVVFLISLFTGLIGVIMINQGGVVAQAERFLFGQTGLSLNGTIVVFLATTAWVLFWSARGAVVQDRVARLPKAGGLSLRVALFAILIYVLLRLPEVSGLFVSQVIVIISLYVLMGLGLNITLGFAGLLDLGFVAFFAIGAYTVGLLTSYGQYGLMHMPFWVAVPIGVLVAMFSGAFLGLPVLGIRGDYLAIATLGFGEIVRILAGSDFLARYFGGPQGIIGIQKPCLGSLEPFIKVDVARVCDGIQLGGPKEMYFVAVISAILVAFVATRLRDSRLGRAWMAIREDEDVAEALGVNLIQTKLLAYMLGAAFAGLGGGIFATLIGSIFASSMQLIVSINVVSLIIVGGMGSIPGVIVGAIALIGLPELLREVSEYRFLFYGAALIIMMLAKPGGLWPSKITLRELHVEGSDSASGTTPAETAGKA
jgi:branched-chain amino acid transport system permease protein